MRRFVPPVPRRASYVRLFAGIVVAVGLALTTISAQIPGRNINMVAGNTWPNGDPYLQRQNEPSIGASTRNPLHLLAGANDYRTVDLPGLAGDETGDAWLGLFKSFDGGQRWISTLLPGYPQDHSPVGEASPIHAYGAGADPVVRAGTNGMMYYAGLVFDRSNPATPDVPGKSAIFVARFIDNNNKEAGDPFEYLGTRTMQTDPGGATGNFLDKPWMVVDIPRDNTRCTIVTAGKKGPITQSIPAGPVYVAYTVRSTDNKGARYDVYFTRSTDCGNTWMLPIKLNANNERANQGAAMAIDPRNGNVYIAWRQFDVSTNGTGTDALMTVKYTPGTRKLDPPGFAHKFAKPKNGNGKGLDLYHFYKKGGVNKALEAADLSPLDQSTSATQIRFRTNAYPSMTIDETGRVYLVWAERGYDPLSPDPVLGSARVLISSSMDGQAWTASTPVSSENQKGHQLMPSITYAGGKLMLVYYDVRNTRSRSFGKYIADRTAFSDPTGTGLRNTIDLRASMASPGANPVFAPSVAVSEYIEGPRVPRGPNVPWQVNPPNLPMFQKGTAPFIGDYVDVTAAPNFIVDSTGRWSYNSAASSTPPIFHATWTDNRDVRVPLVDANGDGNPWNDYTPVGAGNVPSIFDPTQVVPQCIAGNAGSRNQNIYTARITGGLLVGSPGNTKRLGYRLDAAGNPLTELIQRSFVVFAQNTADTQRRFRFTITNQPVGGRASFDQFSAAPLTVIEAQIPYRSTASRTVYATSTDPHAVINVSIAELVQVNGSWQVKSGGLAGTVILNPDIDNPDIDNPDIDNPDIDNPDIDNAEVYNPDIDNPDIDNPDIDNPDIDNPDIDNPDIDNVRVANPDIDNPDIDNPDIDNPDIDNPDIDNPDIDNPDIDNSSLMSDVTWSITNTGNTTASYNVNLFFAQQHYDPRIQTQLLLYRTYRTPVVKNCELKTETHNVLVTNVPNPQLVTPNNSGLSNPNDPASTNATMYLAPGESARITLRVFDPNPPAGSVVTVSNPDGTTAKISSAFVPNEDVTPVVQQQSVNTEDVEKGVTEPPPVIQFPAPQTVPDSASTSENTPVTINPLANDSTAFGSTKIFSFHPAGMASHSGGFAGDVAFQTSTGFLYTQRGAIDPATNALVGRFPLPPSGAPAFSQIANVRTGINYGRSANGLSTLVALDARPGSATFHQYLAMPAVSPATDTVLAMAIDMTHGRLYAAHGPSTSNISTATTVSVIDVVPGSPTFHQIIRTVSLGNGVRAQSIAVNSRTRKVYVATSGSGVPGGVFVFDDSLAAPTPTKNTNTTGGAWGIVINEASNLVFASTITGGSVAAVYAIDGNTNAVALIGLGVPFRFGSVDERMALHQASGKVLVRMESTVSIIDGQRGSPSRNTVLATLGVGRENGNADIAIDESAARAITVGNFAFQADVIDINSNALAGTIPLSTYAQDVAIDPIHHRAFVSVFTYVQIVDLVTMQSIAGPPVFIESGTMVLNPLKNKAYTGLFTTQADVLMLSGAGLEGPVVGVQHRGRYLYGEWHNHTSRAFIVDQGDSAGVTSQPGSVLVIDGTNDTVLGTADVLPGPFGLGIDQNADKVYVASLAAPFTHGGLTIVDPNNGDTTQATFTAAFNATYPAFPLLNNGALLGFGRHVVANPVTGKVYTMQLGGSASTGAVYSPQTNALTPLDGIAGSPLFDAANPGACGGAAPQPACVSWGRISVIRVAPAMNRVFLGLLDNNNVGRIVALDATTNAVVGSWVGGSHSNRHTASFLVVNEAAHVLYVTDYTNNKVTKLDAGSLLPIGSPTSLPGGPSATAFNVTSNRLYVSAIDGKTIYALDANTLSVISSVTMPLSAYFMWVDEVESRIYASGGDNADESGAMVITDVLGQLGTNVRVTSAGSAQHGLTHLNNDGSVTYTPDAGYSGPDSFSYNIAAPTGTAVGSVTINVVPSLPTVVAFGDGYSTNLNTLLTVAAPGPLGNDATGSSSTTMMVDDTTDHGVLTPQANGSFTYQPDAGFTGVDSFVYHAVTDADGSTNAATVTITVGSGTSLVVTNTNDSGAGSLRLAITTANVEPGSTIRFNIPGSGPFVIQPANALPTITAPTTIDGYTQPGASPNTAVIGTNAVIKIALNGTSISSTVDGLLITGGNSTVRGLAVGGFKDAGIFLGTLGGNKIEGNFIGTDAAGTTAVPNGVQTGPTTAQGAGVTSRSPNNTIGGSSASQRNLISGNLSQGVRVDAVSGQSGNGTGTVVINNLIGTGPTGMTALGNGLAPNGFGVLVGVPNVSIVGNVVSGNKGTGISTFASTVANAVFAAPSNIIVTGNIVGATADGAATLGNTGSGISVIAPNSRIGGSSGLTPFGACTGDCNLVGGNGGVGISVGSSINFNTNTVLTEATASTVEGNIVGLNAAGAAPLGNGSIGILVTASGATVRNNVSSANSSTGISVSAQVVNGIMFTTGANATVIGNRVGLNSAATAAFGNGATNFNAGISVSAPDVTIGGTTAAARNYVGGNGGAGISTSSFRNGTTVYVRPLRANILGNYVGTDRFGGARLPNGQGGIRVTGANSVIGGPGLNLPGGTCAGACNLVSGNTGQGISVNNDYDGTTGAVYGSATDTRVEGNFVGVNASGTAALFNSSNGVSITVRTTVGGSPSTRNLIAGNNAVGISVSTDFVSSTNTPVGDAANSVIRSNWIGLSASGVSAISNTNSAINSNAPNVMIGGSNPADGNIIGQLQPASGITLNRLTIGVAVINAGGNNTVQNNQIGLTYDGLARTNSGTGVNLGTANNQVLDNVLAGGGTTGTFQTGVSINSPFATGNQIKRNIIGTNTAGAAGLGYFGSGINISDGSGNTIGGSPADGNVIVGSSDAGIQISTQSNSGQAPANNVVSYNSIGVKKDATSTAMPNNVGIRVFAATGTSITGTIIGPGNVISANTTSGISLGGQTATGTVVKGNKIGVAADGTTARGNLNNGIFVNDAMDSMIGGATAADGNIIAFNTNNGIAIQNVTAKRISILSNAIFGNIQSGFPPALGIDLNWNGVTANDNNDNDSGANDLQNFPVVSNANNNGATTAVDVDMSTFKVGSYTVQFFSNVSCDASGYGEGQHLVGTRTLVQPGAGAVSLDELLPGTSFITATATDAAGNTSEFSQCLPVTNPLVVTNSNDSGPGSLRAAMLYANGNSGSDTITFNIPNVSAANPAVIALASPLPVISGPVFLNGSSQPGFDGWPVIELSGQNAIANGFETAPDVAPVTIQGFAVTRFTNDGIFLAQADTAPVGNQVSQNWIGVNRALAPNTGNGNGVVARTDNSMIGTNVIAGNANAGIVLENDADNVAIQSNSIGLLSDQLTRRANGAGIVIYGSENNTVINGNYISANNTWGIDLQASAYQVTGTTITSNVIGLDLGGNLASNASGGIHIANAPGTRIGLASNSPNIISGNNGAGIWILPTTGGAVPAILHNYIGLDASGQLARRNMGSGIVLDGPANVGGPNAGERNYISGNGTGEATGAGIRISQGADNSSVRGNVIGLNVNDQPVANAYAGIVVASSGFVSIGGPGNAFNVISGNGLYGIAMQKLSPQDNLPANVFVLHNYIGTDSTATAARGNGQAGINVDAGVGIHIGGNSGSGNVIAFNGGPGVRVMPNAFTVRIQENNIFANSIGIDLGGDGHTANDASGHSGANSYQNYTPLVSAVNSGGSTQIQYDTNSLQFGQFTVEFFISPSCDAGGYGQGKQFIGSQLVNGGSGPLNFNVQEQVLGTVITATASDATGNTSEFSNCVTVSPSGQTLSGTVFYSQTPLSGVTVKLVQGSNASAPPLQTTTTNSAGNYQFNNVPSGSYMVRTEAVDPSYMTWVASPINVASSPVGFSVFHPKKMTLNAPASTSTVGTAHPVLQWTANPQANYYTVQINRTSDWAIVDSGAASGSTSYQVHDTLTVGENYTWQIDAYDVAGHHVGSTENSFNFTVTGGTAWAASGSGTTTVTDNGVGYTPSMSYQNNGPGIFNGDWTFNTVAATAGNIALDYNWTGFHSFFQVRASMEVFVNRGGVDVFTSQLVNAGPENCCNTPSNGFTYIGSTSVTVQPGDTYGFRLHGSHFDGTYALQGTLNLAVRP